jgi:hypothetical protein
MDVLRVIDGEPNKPASPPFILFAFFFPTKRVLLYVIFFVSQKGVFCFYFFFVFLGKRGVMAGTAGLLALLALLALFFWGRGGTYILEDGAPPCVES